MVRQGWGALETRGSSRRDFSLEDTRREEEEDEEEDEEADDSDLQGRDSS